VIITCLLLAVTTTRFVTDAAGDDKAGEPTIKRTGQSIPVAGSIRTQVFDVADWTPAKGLAVTLLFNVDGLDNNILIGRTLTDASGMAVFERNATEAGALQMPPGVYMLVYDVQTYYIAHSVSAAYSHAEAKFAVKPWPTPVTIRVIIDSADYRVIRTFTDQPPVALRQRRELTGIEVPEYIWLL